MSSRAKTLEQISEKYPIILVDTCALMGPLQCINHEDLEGLARLRDTHHKSALFFREYFNNGSEIYVTPFVFGEYSKGPLPYRYMSDEERNLIEDIENNKRVIQFTRDEELLHDELSNRYKNDLRSKFKIEKTDIDFLFSGVILYKSREKSVALISNDTKMSRAWKYLLINSGLTTKEIRLFSRVGNKVFTTKKVPKIMREIA
ncbi:hypothetical protein COV15_03005 [Candidatus Woesearchaeota archaeon CG10_big_fil_rev_8_21_14_0_10_34_12]|nr:MAG: hypothetical protein COV15_03005 [Candidatus Woesearchaeota archaeon CG10_big_fil_rev_8_21_14_0_10_34_12]